jgi:hypothetical protein
MISTILTSFRITVGLLLLCWGEALIAGTNPKTIQSARTTSPIEIDGILSEAAWQSAPPVGDFLQFDPDEGKAPTESTDVRVLYDDDALYVGVTCLDSDPSSITGQLSRRDRSTQADKFSVFIDSYHDHRTAFFFSGSVSGVQTDALVSQDGLGYDLQWDAVWNFNAARLPNGWSAEFRIPFSAIRFNGQDTSDYLWGINFRRFIARKNELDDWVLITRNETPPGSAIAVSKFGHLTGISRIHPPLHIEVLPYVSTRSENLNVTEQRTTSNLEGGLDLKYGMSSNTTLDLAINPDFGQVEVDQSVLNLTVFKTFYPEKRPFFLEGSQLFTFGSSFDSKQLWLFYSRQIGTRPFVSADPGFSVVESPTSARILSAAKFTSVTNDGLTLGAISAVTDRESGVEEDPSGNRQSLQFAERTSYNVVRLKKDILGNSWIGAMATGSFKETASPVMSGGVDWNLRFGEGGYAFDGYVAGSRSDQGLSRVSGSAGKFGIGRLTGEHWLAFSSYDFSSNNFSLDEMGFYSQPREQGGYTQLSYRETQAPDPLRRYAITVEGDYRWNWDGANTVRYIELEPQFEFRNFWILTLDYYHDFTAYDDWNRGIIGLYHRPEQNRLMTILSSDTRKPVYAGLSGEYIGSGRGLGSFIASLSMTIRPTAWMEFDPVVSLVRSRNEETWVYPVYVENGSMNLFADRDLDEYDFSLRGIVTFSRTLSMQFFGQVLLPKGVYTHYRVLSTPDDFTAYNYTGYDPTFNEQILNANVVFRWEYLPGSSFYLVWTHARAGYDPYYSSSFGDNFRNTFKLPMDNVILAKISYWWSL